MAEREHNVVYRALADFDEARKKAKEFRDELRALKQEQEGLNKSTASSNQQAEQSQRKLTSATQEHTRAASQDAKAQKDSADATAKSGSVAEQLIASMRAMSDERRKTVRESDDLTRALGRSNSSLRQTTEETKKLGGESEKTAQKFRSLKSIGNNFGDEFSKYLRKLSGDMRQAWKAADEGESAFSKLRKAMTSAGGGGGGTGIFTILAGGADNLGRSVTSLLTKFSFWPTIILAAAAAAGPLVAILGSLGGVALGAGSAIISLAGTVAALPGLIFAAVGGIGALVTAIAPVAGAFKAYQAAQAASTAEAKQGGQAAEQQAERIKAASKGVEQANRSVSEAERGVAAARRGVVDASRNVEAAHLGVERAERGVEDAHRRVSDAARGVAESHLAVERAERGVEDAEYSLAQANYAAKKAQEEVNEARREAKEDLEDLRREVDRSGLNEERAVLNLVRAQENYAKVLKDPTASLIDRREALLRVREAENDLSDVRRKNKDNAQELNEEEKKGIENSDRVIDAKRAAEEAARRQKDAELSVADARRQVANAQRGVADAQRAVVDANRGVVEAQRALVDANRSVADAQQNVADAQQRVIDSQQRLVDAKDNVTDAEHRLSDAQKGTGQSASSAASAQEKYKEALEKLSPSARKVLESVIDMSDAWKNVSKNVQESLFAPVVGQLGNLEKLLPKVEDLLVRSGAAVGNVAARGIEMLSSGPWTKDFADQSKTNAVLIENMGDAGLSLLDAIRNITRAADPFTRWLTVALKEGAANFADWAKSARNSGSIERFLEVTKRRLQEVWQITKNVGLTLMSWAKAAEPFTDWMMARLKDITGNWRDVAKAQEAATSPLQSYLQRIKPLLSEIGALFGEVSDGFLKVASDQSNIERAITLLQSLRMDILPAIARVLNELGQSGIDQAVVDAIAEILDAIATFLDNGGGTALSTFVTVLAGFVEVLAGIASIPGVGEIIGGIATALAAVAAISIVSRFSGLFKILDGFRWLVSNRGNIRGALADTAKGVVGLQNAGGDTGKTVVTPSAGIGPIGSEIYTNQSRAQDKVGDSADKNRTKVGNFSRTISGLKTAGTTAITGLGSLSGFLGGPWGLALIGATALIGVISGKLIDQKRDAENTKNAFAALRDAYADLSSGNSDSVRELSKTDEKFKSIADRAKDLGLSLTDVSGALNNNDQSLTRVNEQLDIQIAALEAARIAAVDAGGPSNAIDIKKRKDDAVEYKKAINEVAEAQAKSNRAVEDSISVTRTYEDRLAGLTTRQVENSVLSAGYEIQIKELSGALDSMANASSTAEERSKALGIIINQQTGETQRGNEATERYQGSILDLKEAVEQNGKSLSLHTREGLRNRDALQAAAGSARDLFLQDVASKVPMDEATKRHKDRIEALKREARELGLNKEETKKLIDTYGDIPDDIKTEIKNDPNGFKKVYNDLRRLQYMQDALRRGLTPDQAESEWKKAEGRRVTDEQRQNGVGRSPSGTVGDGYGAQRFATGGPVYGEGTRSSDSIRAWLSNGEYVQPTNVVEHYGVPVMEALRSKKLDKSVIAEALPGATGGFFKGGMAGHGTTCSACSSGGDHKYASGGSVNVPFVVNPRKTKVDEGWVSGGLGFGGSADGLGGGNGPGGYKWQMAALRAVFPGLELISGFRPGSRTLSGNRSYHAAGRAVDLAPRRDVAKWIYENYGKQTKELITPFPEYNLHNGKPHRYTGAIWNQHNFAGGNAHDHWAYKDGGLVSGGMPQFGLPSLDMNSMLSGAAMPGASSSQLSQAAQSVINQNRGVHVENLNVTNPVPERASDSLSRQVTKLAVLGDI
jgi:hypothetical protein